MTLVGTVVHHGVMAGHADSGAGLFAARHGLGVCGEAKRERSGREEKAGGIQFFHGASLL